MMMINEVSQWVLIVLTLFYVLLFLYKDSR